MAWMMPRRMPPPRWFLAAVLCGLPLLYTPPAVAAEEDPFGGRLIPIEAVMAFRKQIDLTDAQNARVGVLFSELQKEVASIQWGMQSAYFELLDVLDQSPIDPQRATEFARGAIEGETKVKLAQLRMLIEVRNLLTNEQFTFLRARIAEGWKATGK